jgi:hypothetical protein
MRRLRRLLRSTAIILALGFFIPAPSPVTGIVFNPAAYADPYTGKIPDWISSACCGAGDAHKLRADQIQRVSGDVADHLRPGASPDYNSTYYVVEGYNYPIYDRAEFIKPSQDGDYWLFYREESTYSSLNGQGTSPQSSPYCFFIPMAF